MAGTEERATALARQANLHAAETASEGDEAARKDTYARQSGASSRANRSTSAGADRIEREWLSPEGLPVEDCT